jgi:hypothetical protein
LDNLSAATCVDLDVLIYRYQLSLLDDISSRQTNFTPPPLIQTRNGVLVLCVGGNRP